MLRLVILRRQILLSVQPPQIDLDYGDAPDTYGTDNTDNAGEGVGASHIINPSLYIGATSPDADSNGFVDGTDNNGNATDDDDPNGTGTGNGDDEDDLTLPTLTAGDTNYTIPAANITATNTTGQAATLHAWIDFDNSGTFEATEHTSVAVNDATNGGNPVGDLTWNSITAGAAGNTYARFRLTTDSSINNTTPGGAATDGEVEDYQIAIAPATASVTGQVLDDTNYNGVLDQGETGFDGVIVNLYNTQGELQATTTTANGGVYEFTDLTPGEYYVSIESPSNQVLSPQGTSGDSGTESDFDRLTNSTASFNLQAGNNLNFIAALAADTDGDLIADVNEQGDRDGDGVPDAEEIDPAGFFYDEASGEIISGGSISVDGPSPGSVNLVDDGADGSYQFFGRDAGTYTITVNSPPGYEPSAVCGNAGSFDPTGGPDPTSLGSGENGTTGFLVNSDCASNTFYLTFELEAGDPLVINNNFAFQAIADNSGGTAGPPTSCDGTLYLSRGDNASSPTELNTFDPNNFSLQPFGGTTPGVIYNAIGVNFQDGYIYGMNPTTYEIYRIDANGTPTSIGVPVNDDGSGQLLTAAIQPSSNGNPANAFTGDVGIDGIYYVAFNNNPGGGTRTRQLVQISLPSASSTAPPTFSTPTSLTLTTSSDSPRITDFAFNPIDQKLYAKETQLDQIVVIDPALGTAEPFGNATGISLVGAAYFDAFGTFYGYENSTGDIYKFNIDRNDPNAGQATLLTDAPVGTGRNDGASCPYLPVIQKTISSSTLLAGEKGTYTFTIANPTGTTIVTSFQDILPAGLTYLPNTLTATFDISGATINSYGQTDNLTINNLTIPSGTNNQITAEVLADLDLAPQTLNNEAILSGLVSPFPTTVSSDNPDTPQFPVTGFPDPTPVVISGTSLVDYGDAPVSYDDTDDSGTIDGSDTPAVHVIDNNLHLGTVSPDDETAPATSTTADGDDNSATDDEDSFTTLADVPTTGTYDLNNIPVTNTSGDNATLHAWIDFDQDGKFEVGEYQSTTVADSATTASLSWTVPGGTTNGNTVVRFRLTGDTLTDDGTTADLDERSIGIATDGEVEDYQIAIASSLDLDYGDAPDTYGTDDTGGNSSNTSDPVGASHAIDPDLFLGATAPDADSNGFVDGTDDHGNATDDDDPSGTGNGDDEDDFTLPALFPGALRYTIPAANITATNTTGQAATLHGWIDFDHSGTFEDTEHTSVAVDDGTNGGNPAGDLTWNNITAGAAGNTYARFRLTTDSAINNTTPGGAASDGEVEDYQIAIAPGTITISGTVFEDMNYGGGAGRNFATAEASATASGFPLLGTYATGTFDARVELYSYDGIDTSTSQLVQQVTTDGDGNYIFEEDSNGDPLPSGHYLIRVVNNTILSNREINSTGEFPFAVQTFRNDPDETEPEITDEVGGAHPALEDSGTVSNFGDPLPSNAQSVTAISGVGEVNHVDFGFNFDTIVNTNDSGQGSLRQFLTNSRELDNDLAYPYLDQDLPNTISAPLDQDGNPVNLKDYETSIFMIPDPNHDSRVTAGTGVGQINLTNSPPDGGGGSAFVIDTSDSFLPLRVLDPFISIDGRTQNANINTVENLADETIGSNETKGAEIIISRTTGSDVIYGQFNNLIFHSLSILSQSGTNSVGLLLSNNGSSSSPGLDISNVIMEELTVATTNCGIQGARMIDSVIRNSIIRDSGLQSQCNNIQLRGNSNNNLIEDNLILRSSHYGIQILSGNNLNNIIHGNLIIGNGTNVNTRQNAGIGLNRSTNTTITENLIRDNLGDGIVILPSASNIGNVIQQNSIFNNGELGIDLSVLRLNRGGYSGDGVTANDAGDSDSGPNLRQNFPVIDNIISDGTNYTIEGRVETTPNTQFDIELYSNAVCNPDTSGTAQSDNYGEGEKYHDTMTVTTDSSGQATFSIPVAISDLAGNIFTTTATATSSNNTSEFSECFSLSPDLLLVKRITAINPEQSTEIQFNNFIDDSTDDDNNVNWLGFDNSTQTNTYTLGEIDGGLVKPGDEVEYTIYFLSSGSETAQNVLVCDLIPENLEFSSQSFKSEPPAANGLPGAARGILWQYDGNIESLTDGADGDAGYYFPPGVEPSSVFPNIVCDHSGSSNTNGAVVVNLGDLPGATNPGIPTNSYGFIRFRAKVK